MKQPSNHHRRSIRLSEYDYAQPGAYFITVCTHQHVCLFGEIVDGEMRLNEMGRIARDQWLKIPDRSRNVTLDHFIVMPNHIYVILLIMDKPVGAGFFTLARGLAFTQDGQPQTGQPQGLPLPINESDQTVGAGLAPARRSPTVGDIVGAYKSLVANECLKINKSKNEFMGKLWQRNYYERIIRNEAELNAVREYIANNPQQWALDVEYRNQ